MGWLSKLVGGAQSAKDAVAFEIDKFNRQDDALAMVAIMARVAGADGSVDAAEVDAGTHFIRVGDTFAGLDKSMLESKFREFCGKATNAFLVDDVNNAILGIKDEPETRKKVIRAGIAMAGASGGIDDTERDALVEICQLLGENPRDYKTLAA